MTGRKCPVPLQLHQQTHPVLLQYENFLCEYLKQLNNVVMSISQQVTEILTKEQDRNTSLVEVGNWVLRKVNKLNWSFPLWTGPFKVAEAISHCVKV